MRIDVDVSELLGLADDLNAGARAALGKARPAVAKGAVKIKQQLQSERGASGHFGQAASSISFDLTGNAAYAEAEIGPTKGGAGSLANIAYFGGANGGGGTVPDPMGALEAEAPSLEQALAEIADDIL